MYLTYTEYTGFGGNLTQIKFNEYEFTAEELINYHTFNRLVGMEFSSLPERTQTVLKRCMFQIIKLLQTMDGANALSGSAGESDDMSSAGVHLMKNDGVEITYNTQSADSVYQNSKDLIAETINRMLDGLTYSGIKRLTYRGLYPGE